MGGPAFLFGLGPQLIGWDPPTLGKIISLLSLPNANVYVQEDPHSHTQTSI